MDIPRYRIGNDLTVLWAICNNDGTPFDLSGKGVRLFVTNERGMTEVVPTITTDKNGSITNVILWTFLGNNQKVLGKHTLTVEIVTADDKRVIKRDISDAFNLVARSEGEESGGEANAVDSGTIYLSTKLDVYRFGNARVEIGTNGNWFIDGYDTGRTALAGEPGIVHNIYTKSDLGKEFDPDSKIDTFNAHAINAINNALKRMTMEQLQDLSLADLEEYDVLAYNGNAWLNVPFRDLLNIFKGPSESSSGIGDGFWYLNEQDGKIHTDIGIVVHGDAIIEGDTSSGGEGQDTPAAGLDEQAILDLLEREKYVTEDDIEGLIPDVDLSEYAKTEDVETAISEVWEEINSLSTLLSSMWHLDENGNLVTDKQVLIKNNLIIDGDTSSGGEGEDTPGGGISGVKVNGVTYYDDNGDGVIDLGTISGGGGTADLSNYYTKSESDNRYLASSLLGSNTLIHSGNIGSQSVASAKSLVASDGTTYVSYNSTYGQVNVRGINIGYGGNTIERASSGKLYIQKNVTQDTILNQYGGNVGIGTESPSAKLHVDGQINLSAGTNNNYSFIRSENYSSNISLLRIGTCYGYGSEASAITAYNGCVGIGVDIPQYKLDVNGDISAMSALRIGGCGTSYCGLYPNNQITSGGDSSKLWLYNESGLVLYGTTLEIYPTTILYDKLGIGISSPTCALDVVGGIKATKPIFGYMYSTSTNAAAFIFDKPGLNYTGIGSDGVSDTIRFGACDINGTWVSYNQKWKFYGDIIVTGDVASA